MLDVQTVGLAPDVVPYTDGWALQREIHADVVAGARPDTLLLLEHEAVFTAGARTARNERPTDGTPVVDVDRGGKITWHGPGQLVGYPIVRLTEPVDVVAHVRRLEQILIDVLAGSASTATASRAQRRLGAPAALRGQDRGDRRARPARRHDARLRPQLRQLAAAFLADRPVRHLGCRGDDHQRGARARRLPADVLDAVADAFRASFAAPRRSRMSACGVTPGG
jgi:lipoyl(octanoyl) transferase